MKIIQLLPTISYGDAVGNDTLAIADILIEMGYETAIYAENIDRRLPRGTAIPVSKMPELSDKDFILYHESTGTDLNDLLPKMKGHKVMVYHNITPPAFFKDYNPAAMELTRKGLQGVKRLAGKMDACIADSDFNRGNLLEMGFTCPIEVCPILIPFEDYKKEPDRKIMRQYGTDGVTNLLFVGRIAPNKKQEDVIRAFYAYHKFFNSKSRLILCGSHNGETDLYYLRLVDYVEQLGLKDSVIFTGHIKFNEILAWYRVAAVFVCMSEHEGFCVPLVEAMFFGVPIVAYKSTAIPYTLGGSGVLLENKDPLENAKAIHQVVSDEGYRQELVRGQNVRLKDFSYEVVSKRIERSLKLYLGKKPEKRKRIAQVSTTLSRGDAVSNDVRAFQKVFVDMGYPSPIFTEIPPSGEGWESIHKAEELSSLCDDDILLYHHATGSHLPSKLKKFRGKKILVYHNVTPPSFFQPYNREAANSCQWGIDNLKQMRSYVSGCISVSEFNNRDLVEVGYHCKMDVCPIVIPFEEYAQVPDKAVMKQYSDGRTNVIFVGRCAPNKKFEDIITAFVEYKKLDQTARLILVGSYNENDKYYQFLQKHVKELGVTDVKFTGHISFSEILAYYRTASAFLCMSEHEGFCVPLVEAMYFDVPIVAYASTAIPGTLNGSGVLLNTKKPVAVADALYALKTNHEHRNAVIEGQRKRLADFSVENTSRTLRTIIEGYLEENDER